MKSTKYFFYDFDETLGIQDFKSLMTILNMEEAISNSTPLPSMIKMASQYQQGHNVFVLTARPESKSGRNGISKFLEKNGVNIPKSSIYMVGGIGKAKSDVIKQFFHKASYIEFHDDLIENIRAVESAALEEKYPYLRTFWICYKNQ